MFDNEYRYQAHSEHAKQLSLMSCYCRVYALTHNLRFLKKINFFIVDEMIGDVISV